MGSLSGRSTAPTQPVQQVIYVPTPSYSLPETPSGDTDINEDETLQQRAENILKRSRSRLGTVLTGFKGVLSQGDLVAPRKTLLGE